LNYILFSNETKILDKELILRGKNRNSFMRNCQIHEIKRYQSYRARTIFLEEDESIRCPNLLSTVRNSTYEKRECTPLEFAIISFEELKEIPAAP